MWFYLSKIVISALIIVLVSEIAKRNSGFAALVASLPLTSLLAIIWLRIEGSQIAQIAELSQQIFWLVLPSLALFLLFPMLLRYGLTFWLSLSLASSATILCYLLMIPLLRRFGVSI
ncbi:DUF3147 family protein [Methyloglobulus sp.]|uniref:DUF3147 family protein n=1 Tax=Methyloglobulus sp. TaxID=2518622 RepID=UPI0032B87C73